MTDQTIHAIEKRTGRYWLEDGLWDLGFGLVMVTMGLLLTFVPDPAGSELVSAATAVAITPAMAPALAAALALAVAAAMMGVMAAAFFLLGWAIKYLKERITYPRAGYVAYRRRTGLQRSRRIVIAGFTGAVVSALMAVVASLPAMHDRTPAVAGALLGMVTFYLGIRFGVMRYYGVGFCTILLGLGVSLINTDINSRRGFALGANGIFFIAFGLLWMVCGGLALWAFLRRNRPDENDNPSPGQAEET